MALDFDKTDGLHPSDVKFLEIVKKFGWHVMTVMPRTGERGSLFSYSTGLFRTYQHPEILLFNLPVETMPQIINEIGNQVKAGKKFEPGPSYSDILASCSCVFRPVLEEHFSEYVGYSLWFYDGDPFALLQCFWPDPNGRFPWEPDCDARYRDSQPLLYLPPESTPGA
jgi:hypothetical protein